MKWLFKYSECYEMAIVIHRDYCFVLSLKPAWLICLAWYSSLWRGVVGEGVKGGIVGVSGRVTSHWRCVTEGAERSHMKLALVGWHKLGAGGWLPAQARHTRLLWRPWSLLPQAFHTEQGLFVLRMVAGSSQCLCCARFLCLDWRAGFINRGGVLLQLIWILTLIVQCLSLIELKQLM